MDRFLYLCSSGPLSTICRPLSLTHGPYSFTRSQWTFPCHKLFACKPPSSRSDLLYCTRTACESFYVTSGTLHIVNGHFHVRAGGSFPHNVRVYSRRMQTDLINCS